MNFEQQIHNVNRQRRLNILKGFVEFDEYFDNLEKARSGVYANTPENRKLGRVGRQYGSKKEEEVNSKTKSEQHEQSKELTAKQIFDYLGYDKMYFVEYGNDSGVDKEPESFTSKEDAAKEMNYVSINDFDNPNSSSNYVRVYSVPLKEQELVDKLQELRDGYDEEDEITDEELLEQLKDDVEYDKDYYLDFDNDDEIEQKNFKSINEDSDELLSITEDKLGKDLDGIEINGYIIKHKGKGKYSTLEVYDLENYNEEEDDIDEFYVKDIKLRIADHSYNPANNSSEQRSGDFISVEIANLNATKDRFGGKYSLQFDSDNDYDDILDSVKERLEEIL